jgi:pyruvate ferredoxin oxidoreductase gamma subunit
LKEIRIHGRGGQGSVVMAELLATAAFEEGKYSQAFPYLGGGGERRGAPVQAFARISEEPIKLREKIQTPDYVIVQDTSIMDVVDVFKGIKPGGVVLINTDKNCYSIDREDVTIYTVDANKIALNTIGRPIMNTTLMGAFAGITGQISIGAIERTIQNKFEKGIAEKNIKAAKRAHEAVRGEDA